MKKILLFVLLLIPFIVKAEGTCDSTSVKIESIETIEKSDYIEEVNKSSASGNEVNLDLKVNNVGDNIKYKLVLKNTAEDDYEIDKSSLNLSTDYLNYELVTEDNSNIVKAGEEKVVYLIVKYANAVPVSSYSGDNFSDTKNVVINLSNQDKGIVKAIEENPYTSTGIILVIVAVVSGLVLLCIKKAKVRKYMVLVMPVLLLIPCYAHAICKCEIKVESKVNYIKPFTGTVYRNNDDYVINGDSILKHTVTGWCFYDELDQIFSEHCGNYGYIFLDKEKCEEKVFNYRHYICKEFEYNIGLTDYSLSKLTDYDYYLKHDVVDNIVTKSYACYYKDGQEVCLLDNTNDDFYNRNKEILNNAYNGSQCSMEYDGANSDIRYDCYTDVVDEIYYMQYGDIDGNINASKNNIHTCALSCSVNKDGVSTCRRELCIS
ncbi:MAG: hypothetical protein IKQ29_00100 [Bacilli bacterium]|nr:hypothetical protein [Bacilli bacterium]